MARPATAAVRLLTGEREPVRIATTGNISLYGLQTIDGVATAIGDRVLVKDQSDARRNGIYTASEGQWYRAADARTSRTMQKGTTVHVQAGTVGAAKVFAFQTDSPVIGTSAINLSLYLSDNTLGTAQTAATAAANSAAAAAGSATAAAASATGAATSAANAAASATGAAGSATAANTSKANAATSETNAGNSATAAAGSASTASTAATNAGNAATAASGSATTAGTAATNAGNSAAAAAASVVAAQAAAPALPFTFSTTTTDADPGNGVFRLNNVTIASATAAYIDNQDSDGVNQATLLDTFDDSTNTIKGKLTVRSKATATTRHVFNVTGSVFDGAGYRKLTVAYVGGAGAIANAEACWLFFTATGDKGADGLGAGDFIGPASSVADNIVTFAGTTGKAGKDSGVKAGDLIAGPASAVADNIATFNGTTGKIAKDSGIKASDLIVGPASSAADNLVSFNGTTGKLGKDSGVKAADVVTGPASSVTGRVATFNGTSGKIIQDGGFLIADVARLSQANLFTNTLNSFGPGGTAGVIQLASGGVIELGANRTTDGYSFVDFHSAAPGTSDYEARIIRNPGTNGEFQIANTGSGGITIVSGSGVTYFSQGISVGGGQVAFPATDVPSSNANTLDDYEEGTFTPVMVGSTTAGAGTYNAQVGKYTKVGNLVSYNVNVSWTAHTGTGTMTISGLPFTAATTGVVGAVYFNNVTFTGSPQAYIPSATSAISIETAATNANSNPLTVDTAANIRCSGQLFTV